MMMPDRQWYVGRKYWIGIGERKKSNQNLEWKNVYNPYPEKIRLFRATCPDYRTFFLERLFEY